MPLPDTKAVLLANLRSAYQKLDAEFDAVNLENERKGEIGDGISCCDVIAYQLGWGKLLMGWEKIELSGQLAEMPAPGFKWNQLSELAKLFYREHENRSLQDLRQEFFDLYQSLMEWINTLSEKQLFEPRQCQWTGDKWARVKWIQINTIAPYQSARTKVRRWKRQAGIL